MTVEQIKEELSNSFVGLIASFLGYKLTKPTDTGGVDFSLTKDVSYVNPQGKTRFIQCGKYIDLQLKATTETAVIIGNDSIKFDLEAKTFNDLVMRRELANAPLYLILFVLPDNRDNWVEQFDEALILKKHAYWYVPPSNLSATDNSNSVRITIPLLNKLKFETFDNWFKESYN